MDHTDAQAIEAVHATLAGRRLLFAAHHGSRLYGTATARSDTDVRAVFMPTVSEILLGQADFSLDNNPTKRTLGRGDIDVSAFSFMRFVRLLGKFDVNAVEMLFASQPGTPALITSDEHVMGPLRALAPRLISMGEASPIAHARSIVGTMAPDQEAFGAAIETAMDAIIQAEKAMGTDKARLFACPGLLDTLRALPRAQWRAHGASADIVFLEPDIPPDMLAAGRWPHHTIFIHALDRLMPTTMTLHEAKAVLNKPLKRMRGEQAARRARLENVPVSPKDLYHAVRILHQFTELMETKALRFPRPEASTLMGIRTGATTGPALQDILDAAFTRAQAAFDGPKPFPQVPDTQARDALIVAQHRAEVLRTRPADGP